MCNCDRLLQMQNAAIGAVAPGAFMPFGLVNREVERSCDTSTFNTTTSGSNLVVINEPGFYAITYTSSLVAGAAGTIALNLQINGTTVYTQSVTATAAGTFPVNFTFYTRVFCNHRGFPTNLPMNVQVQNATTSVALTDGTSLLQVNRISTAN